MADKSGRDMQLVVFLPGKEKYGADNAQVRENAMLNPPDERPGDIT